MSSLEKYLDKYDNQELLLSIYLMYKHFGYNDEEIYMLDLDFLINNINNIKINDDKNNPK
jgi:hypothetical protein